MASQYLTDEELRKIAEDSDFEIDENLESEDDGWESLSEVEDNVSVHEKHSDTEQISSNLEDSDSDDVEADTKFVSMSGLQWNSEPPKSSKRRAHNIVTSKAGLQNGSNGIMSINDAFLLFISNDMIEEILLYTNRFCCESEESWNREHPDKPRKNSNIAKAELYAFIGILLAAGRNRKRKVHLRELWTEHEIFRQPFFTAAMSRERFRHIYRHIRFDDRSTRTQRIANTGNRLEAIQSTFDLFVTGCIKYYSPSAHICVHERLAVFRGNCPFRVYMKSKPGRYGIKIWVASDCETSYILNLQVYSGMKDGQREVNQGQRVVLDLVRPYFGTWRSITADNFFTSIPLANELYSHKLTITGTIRANKSQIPKQFLANRQREELSSIFGFTKTMTLVSYVPKKNRCVILLSSQFNSNAINEENKKKPEIILHYNSTKGAVDNGDKMTREYSCVRATRRWPLRLFMEILDMAALNAYILWLEKNPDWRKNDRSRRKSFLRELSGSLVEENVSIRKNSGKGHHSYVKLAMNMFPVTEIPTPTVPPLPTVPTTRRCNFCPRSRDRKTKFSCSTCSKAVCVLHKETKTFVYCQNCKPNDNDH